ncbi:MAG: choice-of-anchor Q domain-containing protein, partial [Chloroflexota bacterium]
MRRVLMVMTAMLLAALAPLLGQPESVGAATVTVCASGCAYADIQTAIDNALPGDQVLIGSGTYTLTSEITDPAKSLSLTGSGTASTILAAANGSTNILEAGQSGALNLTVANLTLQGGHDGIVFHSGNLTATNVSFADGQHGGVTDAGGSVTIAQSTMTPTGSFPSAGVWDNAGSVTISNSSLTASQSVAYGMQVAGGASATVIDSTITGFSYSVVNYGTLTVLGSTFSGSGYGAFNNSNAAVSTFVNDTVTNDTYHGLYMPHGTLIADNDTVTHNGYFGILANGDPSTNHVTLNNTLDALNGDDCWITGLVSGSNNLIGKSSSCSVQNGVNGNKVGSGSSPINPMLASLQNNHGPTQTYGLLPGSPALDAGNDAVC